MDMKDGEKVESPSLYRCTNFLSKHAFEQAENEGKIVVLPNEYTLQIDIDTEENHTIFETRIKYLEKWYDLAYKVLSSKSGGIHCHIYVDMKEAITPTERIFLQLYLGSDSKREFLSLQRIRNDDPHPTLFFENKA